jgi:uncharacterized protein
MGDPMQRSAYLASNLLHLILMPTEQCNFRCTYCYEDFDLPRMPRPVVDGIKKHLSLRAPDLDRLYIVWFGGEPLLAADLVEEIQEHVQSLVRDQPRIHHAASMTTNGYLLGPERFARLVALGVREYQITLDGPRDFHDRKRVTAGGGGTFDRIWENLASMRAVNADFEVLVRVHVDPENSQSIGRLVDQLGVAFGGDARFKLTLLQLSRLGGAVGHDLPVLTPEATERELTVGRARAQAHDIAIREPNESDSVCYASRANSFIIRSNGDLAKCTVALSHPENRVGRLKADGTVELDSSRMTGWLRGLWSGNEDEMECPRRGYADAASVSSSALLRCGGSSTQSLA